MNALILAGGLGTRLKSVVANKPKALSVVADNPFLYYVLNDLIDKGVQEFTFSLGYLANQIIDYLQKHFSHISYNYYVEHTPLGTGGAIKKAIEFCDNDNILIVNADTFFDVDIRKMYECHLSTKAMCSIALKEMENFDRYGTVEINEQNTITKFVEKKMMHKGYINGGYVFLNKKYFLNETHHFSEVFSFEKDFIEQHIFTGSIKGFQSSGYFIDIGIPEDYSKAQEVFKQK